MVFGHPFTVLYDGRYSLSISSMHTCTNTTQNLRVEHRSADKAALGACRPHFRGHLGKPLWKTVSPVPASDSDARLNACSGWQMVRQVPASTAVEYMDQAAASTRCAVRSRSNVSSACFIRVLCAGYSGAFQSCSARPIRAALRAFRRAEQVCTKARTSAPPERS